MPRRHRLPRLLAGRAHSQGNARRHIGASDGDDDRSRRLDLRRACFGGQGLRRQRALFGRLYQTLSRRRRAAGSAMTPGLVIAAPRSGSGKTTLPLGLVRAYRRQGLDVVGVKSGPDYIDPAFHAAASGRDGLNLDSWAMSPSLVRDLAARAAQG